MFLKVVCVVLAFMVLVPFVCRLNKLHFTTHRASVVLMHMTMSMSVIWGGYEVWTGPDIFGALMAILGPATWIWVSFPSWKHGIPSHFNRTHEDLKYPEIIGAIELHRKS